MVKSDSILVVENRTPDYRSHPSREFFRNVFGTDLWKSNFAVDYTSASGSPGTTIQSDATAIINIFVPVFWGHGRYYDHQSNMGCRFAQDMKSELAQNPDNIPTWGEFYDFLWFHRADLLSAVGLEIGDSLKELGRRERQRNGETLDSALECPSYRIPYQSLQPGQTREQLYDPEKIGKTTPKSRNITLEFYTKMLIGEMKKNGLNQPLGLLVAQDCQEHGVPFVLFTDKSSDVMESPEYKLVSEFMRAKGFTNVTYGADTSSSDFWKSVYGKVLQESQRVHTPQAMETR